MDNEPMYDYAECIEYIHSRSGLSRKLIDKILELELDYMKSIGIAYEMEEE